ncbi:G2/mitotic-specific cyclin-B [Verticillium dahliae VdLs.17]|uniref:G2/mitotic-specific cyclin-B n=1 Tax=Verticillium dahliae (strain VdLs.17 / ATCC MYA-4575 / FGSC 10137) TaxID=498257 RepID=G2X9K2_VERDV|nr:G2/mitotic-specific cyclin-B [Verticillium dahliae VdLs.17]EGY15670.1 G2/mitotic-specific cyclin-B [Verticillium dahliae VdLs.17]
MAFYQQAQAQQPDVAFFTEMMDEPQRPRMGTRDAAKMIARQRQEIIANELSRLAGDEYLEDIMKHMRHMEDETLPDANLIDMQREIQWYMRPYLIDFLIEAHAAFALLPETLFLTVNLLDRYCSKRVVYKQHYQLVGCAALLIAAKYGDKKDRVPQIHELNNMCCGLYDAGMFTQMEMHVLNTLEWTIGHPTVDFFSQLIVAEEHDRVEVEHMAAYICEIALYHRDFVSSKPSVMARSSLALARAILGEPEVNDGEWDHVDNITLLTLSQHLHQPPSPSVVEPDSTAESGKPLFLFLHKQHAETDMDNGSDCRISAHGPVEEASVRIRDGQGRQPQTEYALAVARGKEAYGRPKDAGQWWQHFLATNILEDRPLEHMGRIFAAARLLGYGRELAGCRRRHSCV